MPITLLDWKQWGRWRKSWKRWAESYSGLYQIFQILWHNNLEIQLQWQSRLLSSAHPLLLEPTWPRSGPTWGVSSCHQMYLSSWWWEARERDGRGEGDDDEKQGLLKGKWEANISGRHLTGLNVLAGWDLHRRRFTKPLYRTVQIWKKIADEKGCCKFTLQAKFMGQRDYSTLYKIFVTGGNLCYISWIKSHYFNSGSFGKFCIFCAM